MMIHNKQRIGKKADGDIFCCHGFQIIKIMKLFCCVAGLSSNVTWNVPLLPLKRYVVPVRIIVLTRLLFCPVQCVSGLPLLALFRPVALFAH